MREIYMEYSYHQGKRYGDIRESIKARIMRERERVYMYIYIVCRDGDDTRSHRTRDTVESQFA